MNQEVPNIGNEPPHNNSRKTNPLTDYSGNIPVLHIHMLSTAIDSLPNIEETIILSTRKFGKVMVRKFTNEFVDQLYEEMNDNNAWRIQMADLIRYGHREVLHSSINQHHPHIMHICAFLYDDTIGDKRPYINGVAIENAPKGSVQDYMKKLTNANEKLSNQQIFSWALQLARVMEYCHDVYKMMHRDIRTANVFVFEENGEYLKLGTFRLAKKVNLENLQNSVLRTRDVLYCAPETIGENENVVMVNYGFSADVWSYGMFLYEITHNRQPFNENVRGSAIAFRLRLEHGERPQIEEYVYPEFRNLIKECWRLERPEDVIYENRPTFAKIVDRLEALTEFDVDIVP